MPCGSMPKGAEVGEATKMTTLVELLGILYLQMLVFPWIWISDPPLDRILEIQLPQRRHRFGPIAEVPGHLVAPGIATQMLAGDRSNMCSAKHPTKTTARCEKPRQVGMHWNLDKARPVDFTGLQTLEFQHV